MSIPAVRSSRTNFIRDKDHHYFATVPKIAGVPLLFAIRLRNGRLSSFHPQPRGPRPGLRTARCLHRRLHRRLAKQTRDEFHRQCRKFTAIDSRANLVRLVTVAEPPNASLRSAPSVSRHANRSFLIVVILFAVYRGLSRPIQLGDIHGPGSQKPLVCTRRATRYRGRSIVRCRSQAARKLGEKKAGKRSVAAVRTARCGVTSRHVASRHVTSRNVGLRRMDRQERISHPVAGARARLTIATNRRSIGRHVTHVRESKPGSQVFLRSRVQCPALTDRRNPRPRCTVAEGTRTRTATGTATRRETIVLPRESQPTRSSPTFSPIFLGRSRCSAYGKRGRYSSRRATSQRR